MKTIKYLAMMVICACFASCMGESYAETDETAPTPYGNNNLKETNLVSIADLKTMFATVISTDYRDGVSYKKVDDNLQIKGIVTSTDVQGNIYNEIALQDKTGAIIVSIAQGGLYGFLPVGTEVLVELKDLYVGNYGLQAQIGVPSTNSRGQSSIGRISRATWDEHYKILSTGNIVKPEVFAVGSATTTWDLAKDGGKLGTIKNVSFKSNNASVDSTYANAKGGAGSVSWTLNEQDGKRVIVYNSNYADFANAKIPSGKVDITGIIKRFNNQWEIIIRTLDDVKPAEVEDPLAGLPGSGKGTLASPFNIERALAFALSGKAGATEYYIQGIVSSVKEVSTQYGNATYALSDDGTTTKELTVFRGLYLDGEKFTNTNQLKEKQKVLLLGKLTLYKGAPQVNTGSKIISIK